MYNSGGLDNEKYVCNSGGLDDEKCVCNTGDDMIRSVCV